MFKKLFRVILISALVFSLVACGKGGEQEGHNEDAITVAFLVGPRGDKSTSDEIWKAAEMAKKDFGINSIFVETPQDASKYRAAVLEAVDSKAELIISQAGSGMIDEMHRAAGEYPDKKFMTLDAPADMVIEHDNFVGENFKQNEAAYLVGYLGGLISENNNIGAIVGVEYPTLSDFLVGYLSGAKDANPNIKVQTSVIGDFVDSAKAKELANVQYNFGADIVFNVAGPSGYGILEAAKEQNKLAFGVDTDQASEFIGRDDDQANVIVSSALKGWAQAAYSVIERYVEDPNSVPWKTVERLGVKEDGVGFANNEIYKKLVSQDIQDQMLELLEDIKKGDIVIPSFFDMTADEYNSLKNSLKP